MGSGKWQGAATFFTQQWSEGLKSKIACASIDVAVKEREEKGRASGKFDSHANVPQYHHQFKTGAASME